MAQTLSLEVAGSFLRQIANPGPTEVLENHVKGLVRVVRKGGPVEGLAASHFTFRIGGRDWGSAVVQAHPEPGKFPGIYTFALNATEHMGGLGAFDWVAAMGLVLAVRVDLGSDYGLAVASLPQIEISHA